MRARSIAVFLVLILIVAIPLQADRRRAVSAPAPADTAITDPLGMSAMRGASVAGTVASVQGTIVTLSTGGAPAVLIETRNAQIVGEGAGPLTLADVTPGSRITAFLADEAPALAAPLAARLVVVDARSDLSVTGTIDSIDLARSTFTVIGITFTVDGETTFATAFPTFAAIDGLEDLARGELVQVRAAFAGSAILARRVLVVAPAAITTVTLRGTVKSSGATNWVITTPDGKDVTLLVDDRTKIVGGPAIGDQVQVLARIDESSNHVALLIVKLETRPAGDAQFRGWVQSIGAEQWTIGGPPGTMSPGMLVRITPATTIYANPKVGDLVLVTGTRDSHGVMTATKIAKAD